MKLFRSLAVSILLLVGHAAPAHSEASAVNAIIQRMQINKNLGNMVFIQLATPPVDRGSCTGSPPNPSWHFLLLLDDETGAGKSMYAQLLVAFAAGQPVDLGGTGLCPWGTVEELKGVALRAN
ncbi:hypothetical protein [Peristeroidobacter soli]|jgi:hypothetical protein|uniref:hypothetical protein n=1 Tax=Peristeroidobacter soli TaxID=2497877 RepID=UPI00101CAA9F|nr:hypothetical protein [Peristeroidobacter soli]